MAQDRSIHFPGIRWDRVGNSFSRPRVRRRIDLHPPRFDPVLWIPPASLASPVPHRTSPLLLLTTTPSPSPYLDWHAFAGLRPSMVGLPQSRKATGRPIMRLLPLRPTHVPSHSSCAHLPTFCTDHAALASPSIFRASPRIHLLAVLGLSSFLPVLWGMLATL